MPRLFTGIALPEAIRDQLSDLEAPIPGCRWIENDNLHITLRFAGDISNAIARDFSDMLAGISQTAFSLHLAGVDVFGGRQPHSLYAKIASNAFLDTLARANEHAARSAGLPASKRNFVPHVTIARLKHPNEEVLARYLSKFGTFRSSTFQVSDFDLFSSRPHVGGGPYISEETYPLIGAHYASMAD